MVKEHLRKFPARRWPILQEAQAKFAPFRTLLIAKSGTQENQRTEEKYQNHALLNVSSLWDESLQSAKAWQISSSG